MRELGELAEICFCEFISAGADVRSLTKFDDAMPIFGLAGTGHGMGDTSGDGTAEVCSGDL